MNKFFFVAFFVLTSVYSQYSRVTVYDQYGNNLGYYNVQSDYLSDYNYDYNYDYSYGNDSKEIAREVGNEIRMAVNDLIEYLEERETREAKAKAIEMFNRRAAKFGMSSGGVFGMDEPNGINPAMEAYVGVMEAAERRKEKERAEQAEEDRRALNREKARYYKEQADKLARERKAAEKKIIYRNSSITSYTKSRGFLYSKTDVFSESFILPKYTPVKKTSDLINNLWYRVRVEGGENKGKTGYLHKTSFEE